VTQSIGQEWALLSGVLNDRTMRAPQAAHMKEASSMTTRLANRLGLVGAAALLTFAVSAGPLLAAEDSGSRFPPPSDQQGQKAKKKKKQSQEQLREGYQRARALIMEGQYEPGIAAMRALDHDDNPEVANFIGYASRKLGRYEDSKFWYEKALAADPNHVRTWSYYGMWHAEQGNRLMAQDYLEKVRLICGNTSCEEYTKLKGVIEGAMTY
jgi:tetratricopeptide (TPR) repeat protein